MVLLLSFGFTLASTLGMGLVLGLWLVVGTPFVHRHMLAGTVFSVVLCAAL